MGEPRRRSDAGSRRSRRHWFAPRVAIDEWHRLAVPPDIAPVTHVICFEGEGAEIILCHSWADCRQKFFDGIFGDSHHDWDEEQVKAWDADFANADSWSNDESGNRYRFTSDIGEISKVRLYCVAGAPTDRKMPA